MKEGMMSNTSPGKHIKVVLFLCQGFKYFEINGQDFLITQANHTKMVARIIAYTAQHGDITVTVVKGPAELVGRNVQVLYINDTQGLAYPA